MVVTTRKRGGGDDRWSMAVCDQVSSHAVPSRKCLARPRRKRQIGSLSIDENGSEFFLPGSKVAYVILSTLTKLLGSFCSGCMENVKAEMATDVSDWTAVVLGASL